MRPSSISGAVDGVFVASPRTTPSEASATYRHDIGVSAVSMAHGALAHATMRALGFGADGQAWRGASLRLTEPLISAGASTTEPVLAAWSAARILPTPQGHARAATVRPMSNGPSEAVFVPTDGAARFRAAVAAAHGTDVRRAARRPRSVRRNGGSDNSL